MINNLQKYVSALLVAGVPLMAQNSPADELRTTLLGSNGQWGASNFDSGHKSNGVENGTVKVDDDAWPRAPATSTQPEMKIVTNPYDTELSQDIRPILSQSKFLGDFALVNHNNTNNFYLFNSTTNRIAIQFNPDTDGNLGDTNRLYLLNVKRLDQHNPSGQELNLITNLANFVPFDGSGYGYINGLPAVVNATNNLPFANFELSCKFTNQLAQTGSRTPITIDLSKDQVSGLEYELLSGTNVNGGAELVNGTNLVYTPNTDFEGTNNINTQLKWNGNVLGNINYAIGVNEAAPNIAPTNSDMTIMMPANTVGHGLYPVGDPDGSITNIGFVGNLPSGFVNNGTNGWTWDPAGFIGTTYVSFYAVDDDGAFSTTNVLSLVSTNTVPTIESASASGSKLGTMTGWMNASDPDGHTITLHLASALPTGNLTFNGTNWTYDPQGFVGANIAQVYAQDNYGGISSTNILTLITTNRSPMALDGFSSGNKVDVQNGWFEVMDSDGMIASIALEGSGPAGFIQSGITNWTFNPGGIAGTNTVLFYAVDDNGAFSTTNMLTLVTTNRVPVANGQTLTNLAETGKAIELSGMDPDGDALTFSISAGPSHGTLSGSGSNRVYTSENNFHGEDSFSFLVNDGFDDSLPATVTIEVEPVNREPVVSAIRAVGENVEVEAMVQPNRTTLPQERLSLADGWSDLSGLSQVVPMSTNLLVPATFTIPRTNDQGFYRLKSVAD